MIEPYGVEKQLFDLLGREIKDQGGGGRIQKPLNLIHPWV